MAGCMSPPAPRVSIHAPVKGATPPNVPTPLKVLVSIHAPVKGATGSRQLTSCRSCFNPRAREGRDSRLLALDADVAVSIHAPVKGATRSFGLCRWSILFQSTRP